MTSGSARRSRVLLLSCYELGHQPLGLAMPLAFLERAGISADAIDLSVQPLDEKRVRRADFLGVSVPMHTALRIALELLPRLRRWNAGAHICFYGLYATLNAELLLAAGVDSVLSGEYEESLVERVRATGERRSAERVSSPLERLDFPVASREMLPALDRYAALELPGGLRKTVGAVETTRGCLHLCRHCPIPPVYRGRFTVVPEERVLADVRRLVALGAHHIDFVDPDFLNGPGHALSIVRALKREHPGLTFDFTAKVEHLVKYSRLLPELRELGCLFVVSAVESLSNRVLAELDKGHERDDVFTALALVREAGIGLRPTFVAFTPWTTRGDYLDLLEWIAREGLVDFVDPVQLTLRLLVPPGSLLLQNERLKPHLGALDARGLTYRWAHPDPEMDRLQESLASAVERGVAAGLSSHEVFHDVRALADGGNPSAVRVRGVRAKGPDAPRLTESWFC